MAVHSYNPVENMYKLDLFGNLKHRLTLEGCKTTIILVIMFKLIRASDVDG